VQATRLQRGKPDGLPIVSNGLRTPMVAAFTTCVYTCAAVSNAFNSSLPGLHAASAEHAAFTFRPLPFLRFFAIFVATW
jgi:hypothetical protein